MPSLAGTKRPAETPVASPTKAAALTKKSRTHYDYYEEEDAEQSEEETWSGDDWSDGSSVMDLDDADEVVQDELLSPDDLGDDDFDERLERLDWNEKFTGVRRLNSIPKMHARRLTNDRLKEMRHPHGIGSFIASVTLMKTAITKAALAVAVARQDGLVRAKTAVAEVGRRVTTRSTT